MVRVRIRVTRKKGAARVEVFHFSGKFPILHGCRRIQLTLLLEHANYACESRVCTIGGASSASAAITIGEFGVHEIQ